MVKISIIINLLHAELYHIVEYAFVLAYDAKKCHGCDSKLLCADGDIFICSCIFLLHVCPNSKHAFVQEVYWRLLIDVHLQLFFSSLDLQRYLVLRLQVRVFLDHHLLFFDVKLFIK